MVHDIYYDTKVVKFSELPIALSFDDVLLVPQYSEVSSRSDVNLTTRISDKVELTIPLISANVDTITGVEMAIAMGKLGGLGILPRFEPVEETAKQVSEIKKAGVLAAASIGVKSGEEKEQNLLLKQALIS